MGMEWIAIGALSQVRVQKHFSLLPGVRWIFPALSPSNGRVSISYILKYGKISRCWVDIMLSRSIFCTLQSAIAYQGNNRITEQLGIINLIGCKEIFKQEATQTRF